nr:hypothetical protein [Tanacetum cinerariifolium]
MVLRWWWRGDVDDESEGGDEMETVVRWCSDNGDEEIVVVSAVAWRLSHDGVTGWWWRGGGDEIVVVLVLLRWGDRSGRSVMEDGDDGSGGDGRNLTGELARGGRQPEKERREWRL